MKTLIMSFLAAAAFAAPTYGQAPEWWGTKLQSELSRLGHRNWIAVVDSAYPSQTAPGIKLIYTGEKQLDVVRYVLDAVGKAKHVRGSVFVDAELPYVPETSAKGITDYRAGLKEVLKGQQVKSLPHGKIIERLDAAGQAFHVLVLKTDLTLPYTSVFIRLDCGYWSDDAEDQLREAMEAAKGATQ